jgi:hypothetical protein
MLLPEDQTFLERMFPGATVAVEAGMTCVVMPEFLLPTGFTVEQADLLVCLNAGYPDVAPDMWWFSPAVLRADGVPIPATEATQHVVGREWQRWSRHFNGTGWLAGTDTLESYVALVRREVGKAAA